MFEANFRDSDSNVVQLRGRAANATQYDVSRRNRVSAPSLSEELAALREAIQMASAQIQALKTPSA